MNTWRWMLMVGIWAVGSGLAGAQQEVRSSQGQAGLSRDQSPVAAQTQSAGAAGGYDFGDFKSETLVGKAWNALTSKDYAAVEAYAGKCISLYEERAMQQGASLTALPSKEKTFTYWALNDVATAYFILGQARLAQGRAKEAQEAFNTVVTKFPLAQAWDPKGWFWKVADAATDKLNTIGTDYDFGDYASQTLATKAWGALDKNDHRGVELYTKKCIALYETQAVEQASNLTDFAPKEKAHNYWALNDVATAYFILGRSFLAQGRVKEAQEAFNTVISKLPYAQAWDPKGWFWKVAQAASDKLSTIGTPYDFGDYTSQTLTTKAWEVLGKNDHRGVELFTKKCIELYEADAKKQQASLAEFAPKDKVFNYWALNDVGTCYFIWGESLMAQKRSKEAKAAFERVVNDFGFSQCWDPKGWFWKVAAAARGRLNKIMVEGGY